MSLLSHDALRGYTHGYSDAREVRQEVYFQLPLPLRPISVYQGPAHLIPPFPFSLFFF